MYVIGHRNPDTDSVASAIAYAGLKRLLGTPNAVAAMAGALNPQTRYVLERFGSAPPVYLTDVHPKVKHALKGPPVTAGPQMTLKEALELFHRHNVRVLPVIDENDFPIGIVSLLRLSEKYLVAGNHRGRGVEASLRSLAECLDGTFLAGCPTDQVEQLHLYIGAMVEESFSSRIAGHDPSTLMIMTGNRRTIQQAAIERGVRLLVITGAPEVDADLVSAARERGVTVISTPLDTAAAAGCARLSTPLSILMESKFASLGVGEPLEHLRLKIIQGGESAVVALEEDGTIAGIATKTSLLAPIPYGLILVDHNELGQAVPGAESVEILEIIDHHRLGNSPTILPITCLTSPVGSTCTIVAGIFREKGLEPAPDIAGLLLAGILSDTVILRSATTTPRDRELAVWLEKFAGVEHVAFGKEIFGATSGFAPHPSLEEAVRSDFKHFRIQDIMIGVGQVEVVGFGEFYGLKEDLRGALKRIREEERLPLVGLMVTDVYTETTLFLVDGMNQVAHVMGYPQLEPHLYELKGVMSRKKQLLPHLTKVFGGL
jgi:manganese-dependent inorganic pyrophosphatase